MLIYATLVLSTHGCSCLDTPAFCIPNHLPLPSAAHFALPYATLLSRCHLHPLSPAGNIFKVVGGTCGNVLILFMPGCLLVQVGAAG